MKPTIKSERARIVRASKSGWAGLVGQVKREANNELVKADWKVSYDKLGHDIIIEASVAVRNPKDMLLQLWLKDMHPGIWIPEFRPWVASVVEFDPVQAVTRAKIGLFDSKWRREDIGETYWALFWGYLRHGTSVESFAFDKEFVYPG